MLFGRTRRISQRRTVIVSGCEDFTMPGLEESGDELVRMLYRTFALSSAVGGCIPLLQAY